MRHVPLLVALAVLAGPGAAAGSELPELTPTPLPMAIRDGRIAAITVRAVPFAIGAQELAPDVAQALRALVADAKDDCFLTAQAVGHVRPGASADGDTLAAHRLARARAELVRAALVAGGLPESAVAAVWDYQFTVREPRVTLWLFRLAEGVECRGKGPRPPEPVVAARPPPERVAAPPAPAPAAGPPAPPAVAAPAPPPVVGPPLATAEIRFETGSSFFPRGAEQELRRLVAALPRARAYRFEILAGVDAAPVPGRDPDSSARYNRWLSERRLARVGDWLEQHVEVREVEVERGLAEGDTAPRVVIRARPRS